MSSCCKSGPISSQSKRKPHAPRTGGPGREAAAADVQAHPALKVPVYFEMKVEATKEKLNASGCDLTFSRFDTQ